jgi:hypothetical protein
MPSRTVVYGVGAATGILVGAAIAQLNRATSRERLQRLLGRGTPETAGPTHIVLLDLETVPSGEHAGGGLPDGRGAERAPLAPA